MKIEPLFDRVVLSLKTDSENKKSSIILPAVAQEKSQVATVVEIGSGLNSDGKEIKMQVEKGDKVLYSKYAGTDFKFNGEDYIIIKQTDILAVIKGEKNGKAD